MMAAAPEIARGDDRHSALANAVSDAINAALRAGLGTDEAACIVVQVAADYARAEYGNRYLDGLAAVVVGAASMPMPEDVAHD
jgi:hypothetical protein